MYFSIFNHPQQVSKEQWLKDWYQLPRWRQEKAMRYHFLIDRVLCTEAYLLLKRGLAAHYGIREDIHFDFVAHDKPVLREFPHLHFNLSHCKKGVLCVIDNQPIGCDIEEIEERLDRDVMKICFNDHEINQILHASNPCVEFTKFWTMKEAVLKLTGEGINDDLPTLLTPKRLATIDLQTTVVEEQGYVYSICQYHKK